MSHVFISYSTQNSDYAYQLADKLREEGFDVWIDNRQLRSSDNWWESIVRALRGCGAFIVIMTPEARESRWVQREVTLADKWKKTPFPVLLAGDFDLWEIYVLTRYEDVSLPEFSTKPQYKGKLPPDNFYNALAEYAIRKEHKGSNLTRNPHVFADDEEIRREIANPPTVTNTFPITQSIRTKISGSNTRPRALIGACLLLVILVTSIALFNHPQTVETRLETATNESASSSKQVTQLLTALTAFPSQQFASEATARSTTQVFAQSSLETEIHLTTATPLLTHSATMRLLPSASPSSKRQIAFASNRDGNNEIYVMNADGSNVHNLTNNLADDYQPVWSPNGKQIAFRSNRDGIAEIYIMNADGSQQNRLTNLTQGAGVPTWSPNGKQIVFGFDPTNSSEIYIINIDGSNAHNLTNNLADDYQPMWSPDGRRIAFYSSRDGIAEIYIMNADGSDPTNVSNNSAADYSPAWSPDGKQIAFRSDRNGNKDIYVMNVDGSNPINITNNAADDDNPSWRPAVVGSS